MAWFGLDVGKMRDHEISERLKACRGLKVTTIASKLSRSKRRALDIEESENGSVSDLIMPCRIVSLIVATVAAMLYTYQAVKR
ncbi:hypothetical protein OH492_19535 [Vibrio chagasii]|nr:hypothetical protein [Vibrio chagasii]